MKEFVKGFYFYAMQYVISFVIFAVLLFCVFLNLCTDLFVCIIGGPLENQYTSTGVVDALRRTADKLEKMRLDRLEKEFQQAECAENQK